MRVPIIFWMSLAGELIMCSIDIVSITITQQWINKIQNLASISTYQQLHVMKDSGTYGHI